MTKYILLITVTLITLASCTCNPSQKTEKQKALRHLVFFKFKDAASPNEIEKVHDAFLALPKSISVIEDFEWGLNNSPENLHQDLTHCYMITFSSEADREIYLPHPSHKAFVEKLKPVLDKVVVIDYWAN